MAFVGCILTKKVPAINDKENIENNNFYPIKEIGWINLFELVKQIKTEEGIKTVYFGQEKGTQIWRASQRQ
jgi:hypothetical protein